MIRIQNILFCYFSGTGNTKLIVDKIVEVFRNNEIEVNLIEITVSTRIDIPDNSILGLAFPVAYQSTYPFLWTFFRNLPHGNGVKVFMVDTLAGFSGGIVGPLKKLMLGKGYEPIAAKEIRMPMNFISHSENITISDKLVSSGMGRAASYAEDILFEKAKWPGFPLLSDIMYSLYKLGVRLVFSGWNQRYFKIKTDGVLCTGCGLCAESCPVNNIRLKDHDGIKLPVFNDECEFCLRCLAVCPNDANSFRCNKAKKSYRAPKRTVNQD